MYEQPALASSLLQKIKNVNDHILKEVNSSTNSLPTAHICMELMARLAYFQIHLTKDYHIDRHSAVKGTTLSKLLDIGIKDQYTAQKVFEALLEEAGNTR